MNQVLHLRTPSYTIVANYENELRNSIHTFIWGSVYGNQKSVFVEDVKAALEARRNEIFAANENYVGSLRDKAEAGRVVVKGNYAVLVIGGDEMVVEDQGVEVAYEPIEAAIEEAFK